jgi:hypothetical protein
MGAEGADNARTQETIINKSKQVREEIQQELGKQREE